MIILKRSINEPLKSSVGTLKLGYPLLLYKSTVVKELYVGPGYDSP
jgi:hypothetical protein